MPDPVIEIEHLYKEYRLGVIGYGTLREDLQSWWARARGKEDPNSILSSGDQSRDGRTSDHILALNDINLTVRRGERLGIIGKNGAGKTTLLKILARIASPTKGTAKIKGRAACLIAVGTGFHSELTGRENIYLNGSILGLRKFEIDKRFDEIVDFSGVEQFIDTPVKRYSSGMYVRLGFAVAAHLDPDVLIVDEVLAVGDVEFQNKAINKMKDVSKDEGRTVLFVSHQMANIGKLCQTTLILDGGQIAFLGDTHEAISKYLEKTRIHNPEVFLPKDESMIMKIRSIRMLDYNRKPTINIDRLRPFFTEISYDVYKRVAGSFIVADLQTSEETRICYSHSTDMATNNNVILEPGSYVSTVEFPGGLLNAGSFTMDIGLQTKYEKLDNLPTPLTFNLIDYGTFIVNHVNLKGRVILGLPLKWETERL